MVIDDPSSLWEEEEEEFIGLIYSIMVQRYINVGYMFAVRF